ncbi:MAG: cell division protein FtsA [candidate division WOR-3 bacterium]
MALNIITGIDCGSSYIKITCAQIGKENDLQILGAALVPSSGIRRGIVIDIADTKNSIKEALNEIQALTGVKIRNVNISLNGTHLKAQESRGVVAVSRADKEISSADVERALKAAQTVHLNPNREVIEVIARSFNIDEEQGIKNPVGMSGIRLEVNTIILTASTPFLRNLTKAVEESNLTISNIEAGPLASAEAIINKKQKELGVMVIDFGAETTSMAVYEEGEVFYTNVFPVGSSHITNDIAIGLRTDLDTAERIKLKFGSCIPNLIRKTEFIDLNELGVDEKIRVKRQDVSEIIQARMKEIFELINQELEKINRKGFLPAGAVFTGGGSKLEGLIEMAKDELMLPAHIGSPANLKGITEYASDPAFARSIGLIMLALNSSGAHHPDRSFGGGQNKLSELKNRFLNFFKNLIP